MSRNNRSSPSMMAQNPQLDSTVQHKRYDDLQHQSGDDREDPALHGPDAESTSATVPNPQRQPAKAQTYTTDVVQVHTPAIEINGRVWCREQLLGGDATHERWSSERSIASSGLQPVRRSMFRKRAGTMKIDEEARREDGYTRAPCRDAREERLDNK